MCHVLLYNNKTQSLNTFYEQPVDAEPLKLLYHKAANVTEITTISATFLFFCHSGVDLAYHEQVQIQQFVLDFQKMHYMGFIYRYMVLHLLKGT